jgi:hypothetical protein
MPEARRDLRPASPSLAAKMPPGDAENLGRLVPGNPVRGEVLAHLLTGRGGPRLAVLNACQTARSGSTRDLRPFGGVAAALVLGGVPAVIAMQFPITDRAACEFSASLYERIAAGGTIEEAVAEARRAIYAARPESLEWATPALFLRTETGRLFYHQAEGRQDRLPLPHPPPPLPASAPVLNKVVLKAGIAHEQVDLCAAEGDAAAGQAGESNVVLADIDQVLGPLSVSANRRGRVGGGHD